MLYGMPQIAVRLDVSEIERLDRIVAEAGYSSRAAAVRAGIELLGRSGRERRIARSYERAYREAPLSADEAAALDAALDLAAGAE